MGRDDDSMRPDPRRPNESETAHQLRTHEHDIERLGRDVSALRADFLRVSTDATEHRRHTDDRLDRVHEVVSADINSAKLELLQRMDARNDLLAKLCDHTLNAGAALGSLPVAMLREVKQSAVLATATVVLSVAVAVLAVAVAARLVGLDIERIGWGDAEVTFAPKPQGDRHDYGEPTKAER